MKALYLFIFFVFASINLGYSQDVLSLDKIEKQTNSIKKVKNLNDASEELWLTGDYLKSSNYAQKALEIARKIKDKKGEAMALNNLGIVCDYQGKYASALDYYFKALPIQKAIKDNSGLSYTYNNIGLIYSNQNNFEKALENYNYALEFRKKENNLPGLASTYNNIGIIHMHQKKYELALEDYFSSLKIDSLLKDPSGISTSLSNIAIVYLDAKEYDKALDFFNKGLKLRIQLNDQRGIANSYNNISTVYEKTGDFQKSIEYAKKGLAIGQAIGALDLIKYSYQMLSSCSEKAGNVKDAYTYYREFVKYGDSITNEMNTKKQTEAEMQFKFDQQKAIDKLKQEKKDYIDEQEKKRQVYWVIALSILLLFVLAFALFVNKRRKIERSQKELIEKQKSLVEEKNTEILASITYAKRIQSAILPSDKLVKEFLKNSFIFYQPKDIVAGDFYWMEPKEDCLIFAVADCTGHGVPGALVSVVCNNALNRSVREFNWTDPADILNKTREIILHEFQKSDEIVNDGMDISICNLNFTTNELIWAGANSPLWILQKNQTELKEYKPSKQPIGQFSHYEPFVSQKIRLDQGDSIYLFSDGFADQFGGDDGKKMKSKRMKELILSIQSLPMYEQKQSLMRSFDQWKGDLDQLDDVCVIGVQV